MAASARRRLHGSRARTETSYEAACLACLSYESIRSIRAKLLAVARALATSQPARFLPCLPLHSGGACPREHRECGAHGTLLLGFALSNSRAPDPRKRVPVRPR